MEILTIAKTKGYVIKPFLSQGASIKPLKIKDIHKVRAKTLNLVAKKLVLGSIN